MARSKSAARKASPGSGSQVASRWERPGNSSPPTSSAPRVQVRPGATTRVSGATPRSARARPGRRTTAASRRPRASQRSRRLASRVRTMRALSGSAPAAVRSRAARRSPSQVSRAAVSPSGGSAATARGSRAAGGRLATQRRVRLQPAGFGRGGHLAGGEAHHRRRRGCGLRHRPPASRTSSAASSGSRRRPVARLEARRRLQTHVMLPPPIPLLAHEPGAADGEDTGWAPRPGAARTRRCVRAGGRTRAPGRPAGPRS